MLIFQQILPFLQKRYGPTDGPTDGPTNPLIKNLKGGREKWGKKEEERTILTKIISFSSAILKNLPYLHIFF